MTHSTQLDVDTEAVDRSRRLEKFIQFAQSGIPRQSVEPHVPDPFARAAWAILSAVLSEQCLVYLWQEVFEGLCCFVTLACSDRNAAIAITLGGCSASALSDLSAEDRERIRAFTDYVRKGRERDPDLNGQADMRGEAKVFRLARVIVECIGRLFPGEPDPDQLDALQDFIGLAHRDHQKAQALLMAGCFPSYPISRFPG